MKRRPCTRLCGGEAERRTCHDGANGGRIYWLCAKCNDLEFEGASVRAIAPGGPPCRCSVASTQKTSKTPKNKGRTFWVCARSQCNFFEWVEPQRSQWRQPQQQAPAAAAAARRTRPGFATFLSDAVTMSAIQKMLHVERGVELGVGRDQLADGAPYDSLKVMGAWKIGNANVLARYEAQRDKIAAECDGSGPPAIREAVANAFTQLPGGPLSVAANEVRLLHGTKPENLASILFDGMQLPTKSGLFGAGQYLAEDAAKSDQYCTPDPFWRGHGSHAGTQPELHDLHRRIYSTQFQHPKEVYYLLVCRAALGRMDVTKDGRLSELDGEEVFVDTPERKRLRLGYHSLRAETGGAVHKYREFVLFQPDQLVVEYLVAVHRTQECCHRCKRRKMLEKRTVKGGKPENFGRIMRFCPKDDPEDPGCGEMIMLPACHCGCSAVASVSKAGYDRWICRYRGRERCDFNTKRTPILPQAHASAVAAAAVAAAAVSPGNSAVAAEVAAAAVSTPRHCQHPHKKRFCTSGPSDMRPSPPQQALYSSSSATRAVGSSPGCLDEFGLDASVFANLDVDAMVAAIPKPQAPASSVAAAAVTVAASSPSNSAVAAVGSSPGCLDEFGLDAPVFANLDVDAMVAAIPKQPTV
jgi:hypothetical protein